MSIVINNGEAVRFGWVTFKKNWKLFLELAFFSFIVTSFVKIPFAVFIREDIFASALTLVLGVIIEAGTIKIVLSSVDGKKSRFLDVFSAYRLFFKYLLASLLYGLFVAVGFVLLIVPGIIVAVRLSFIPYIVVDKKLGPIEAIKESWKMTSGKTVSLLLFYLTLLGVCFLGVLALFVGLFVAIPVTLLATGHVYRKLSK